MTAPFPIGNLEPDAVRAFAAGHPADHCLLLSIAVSLKRRADQGEPVIVNGVSDRWDEGERPS